MQLLARRKDEGAAAKAAGKAEVTVDDPETKVATYA